MTSFFIPDTSPVFSYSDGWTAAYKSREDGYDQTFHQSSSSSATVSLNITASSLSFTTYTDAGGCNAQYKINDSSWTDACDQDQGSTSTSTSTSDFSVDSLPAGIHQVQLRAMPTSSADFQLMGVGGLLANTSGSNYSNMTIDNTSPSFVFSPSTSWTSLSSTGRAGSNSDDSSLTTLYPSDQMSNYYDSTLAVSSTSNAQVTLVFKAQAIYLYGLSGPEGGTAQLTLDGEFNSILNMSNPWTSPSSLLYIGSGFSTDDTHTITITNTSPSPNQQLVLDYAVLTTLNPASSSSSHVALIVGIIAGVSSIILIACVTAYILYTRRQSRRFINNTSAKRAIVHPYPFANGLSGKDYFNGSKSSLGGDSRLSWNNSNATTPLSIDDYVGIGIGGDGAHSQPQYMTRYGNTNTSTNDSSPAYEYPDYLPYKGPIEPRPQHRPELISSNSQTSLPYDRRSSTTTIPLIAAANPSASGWLQNLVNTNNNANTSTALRQVDRETNEEGYDEIPLDSYYQRSTLSLGQRHIAHNSEREPQTQPPSPSSISTPSSLGAPLTAMTMTARAVAQPASRSVARLWPTRDAVPSSYRISTITEQPLPSAPAPADQSTSLSLLHPNATTSQLGTIGTGTAMGTLGISSTDTDHNGGSSSMTYSHPSFSIFDLPTPTNDSPSHHNTRSPSSQGASLNRGGGGTLRRGVSIKSVKTMRSFISGLLSASPNTPTPALPQTHSHTYTNNQSQYLDARPDSGIFPLSSTGNGLSRGLSVRTVKDNNNYDGQLPSSSASNLMLPALPPSALTSSSSSASLGLGLSGISPGTNDTSGTGSSYSNSKSKSYKNIPTPLLSPSSNTRLSPNSGTTAGRRLGIGEISPNFFIEFNPNSPITSRPGSQFTTTTTTGVSAGAGARTLFGGGRASKSHISYE